MTPSGAASLSATDGSIGGREIAGDCLMLAGSQDIGPMVHEPAGAGTGASMRKQRHTELRLNRNSWAIWLGL